MIPKAWTTSYPGMGRSCRRSILRSAIGFCCPGAGNAANITRTLAITNVKDIAKFLRICFLRAYEAVLFSRDRCDVMPVSATEKRG